MSNGFYQIKVVLDDANSLVNDLVHESFAEAQRYLYDLVETLNELREDEIICLFGACAVPRKAIRSILIVEQDPIGTMCSQVVKGNDKQ